MIYVSGPVSVYIYTILNKKLFLFGDIHTNTIKPYKKSISIIQFLDKLPSTTDLFIESPYATNKNKNEIPSYESSSVITTLYNHYKDSMYKHNRKNNDFRVHFTDIRMGSDLKLFMNIVDSLIQNIIKGNLQVEINDVLSLATYFPSISKLVKYINLVVLSNNFKEDSYKLFPSFDNHDMITEDSQGMHIVHRIRKQILKLDTYMQKQLLKYHKDKCKLLLNNTKIYDKVIKNAKQHNYILNQHDAIDLLITLTSWTTHLKDMYTLARILYYIIHGNNNIVSYDGNQHTLNYVEFFEKYMDKTIELLHQQSILNKNSKKYLTIPT